MLLDATEVQCPYCWQMIELSIDCSVADQTYVEDCQKCCSPMVVNVTVESGQPTVTIRHEND